MLHVAILSCPHAHAMVKTVDTSAAEKMPGVHAVLKDGVAGTNIPWFAGRGGFTSRLFDPHCRYEGDEVAVVAADTIYQAWDAVRAIKVEYDVQPQVVDVDDAMKPGAPAVRDGGNAIPPRPPYARGDVEAGVQVGRRRASSTRSTRRASCRTRSSCTGAWRSGTGPASRSGSRRRASTACRPESRAR